MIETQMSTRGPLNPQRPKFTLPQVEERANILARQGNTGAHELGILYNLVVDDGMAQKAGFKDAKDFFAKRIKGLSQSALSTYGAVAREFSAEACEKYGAYSLYGLLAYEKVAGIQADASDPGPTAIVVPSEDGTVGQKPFSECTIEDLKLAVKAKRAPVPPPSSSGEDERIGFYRDTVTGYFPNDSRIRVNARVHRGKLLLSLEDVSETELSTLIQALQATLEAHSSSVQ
jgi:hypothetical protein